MFNTFVELLILQLLVPNSVTGFLRDAGLEFVCCDPSAALSLVLLASAT